METELFMSLDVQVAQYKAGVTWLFSLEIPDPLLFRQNPLAGFTIETRVMILVQGRSGWCGL